MTGNHRRSLRRLILHVVLSGIWGCGLLLGPVTPRVSPLSGPSYEHPRLFFTADELPALRKQAETTHREIWEPIQQFADSLMGTLPPHEAPVDGDEDTYRNYGNQLIALAFVCVITEGADYCNLAKNHLLTYASWAQWGEYNYRDLGLSHMIMGNSLGYDWLFRYLTLDEQRRVRTNLASWTYKLYEASSQEFRLQWNNWWRKSYLQGHHWTNYSALGIASLTLLGETERFQTGCLVTAYSNVNLRTGPGITYNVGEVLPANSSIRVDSLGTVDASGYRWWQLTNDLWVREDVVSPLDECSGESELDTLARQWLEQSIDQLSRVRDFLNGAGDGTHHEGLSYQVASLTMLLPFLVALRDFQSTDLLPYVYLSNFPEWRMYNYLPNSIQFLLSYGDFEPWWGNTYGPQNLLRFTAAEFKNGYAEWLAQEMTRVDGRKANVWLAPWYVFEFLYFDPSVVAQHPTDLPLARTFPDLEAVIWRTGWEADDLLFGLKSGALGGRYAFDTFVAGYYPWEAPCQVTECQLNVGHDHSDTNGFYVYWDGHWLAPETAGYGAEATSLHNTIVIDGQDQYRPPEESYDSDPDTFADSDAFVIATADLEPFDYVAVDGTHRYRNIQGIEAVTRAVVFVRPDYLVMVDHVAADSPHHVDWISHFATDAVVEGDWVRGEADAGHILGIAVAAPQPFSAVVGHDGFPYVHISPPDPTDEVLFATVLYPTTDMTWEQRPDVTVLGQSAAMVGLRLVMQDGSQRIDDVLLAATYSDEVIQIGAYAFDGSVAVVRRESDGQTGAIYAYGGTTFVEQVADEHRVLFSRLASREALAVSFDFDEATVTITGDVGAELTLYAPLADTLIVNGQSVTFTRTGDYITVGG